MNDTNLQPAANGPQTPLSLTGESEALLSITARWSRFLGILTFVMTGIMFVCGLAIMLSASILSDYADFAGMPLQAMGIIYMTIAVVYLFPGMFLYRYAERMRAALANRDEAVLTDAFRQHKKLFKFMGVWGIIGIAMILLGIIIGTIAGVASAL